MLVFANPGALASKLHIAEADIVTGPVKVSTKVSIKTADQSYIAEASSKDSQDKDS